MGRIELDISIDRKFQDVALLLDREEVLNFISSIRKKCEKKYKRIKKPTVFDEFIRYDIRPQINRLLTKLKYPPGFSNAVFAAVLNNEVSNNDVKHCYIRFHAERVIYDELPPLETPRDTVLVAMYPYLLKGRKKTIRNEVMGMLKTMNQYFIHLPTNHPLNLDIHPGIRDERVWYWKNKDKIPTEQILKEYNKTKKDDRDWIDDVNEIDQAISRYRRLLTSDI